jgi:hypothetical protein
VRAARGAHLCSERPIFNSAGTCAYLGQTLNTTNAGAARALLTALGHPRDAGFTIHRMTFVAARRDSAQALGNRRFIA